jgi:WhiB family transcriptional regulator, redox-sensing transcriptional regulator
MLTEVGIVAAPLGDWAAKALCRIDKTVDPAIFDTDPLRSKRNMVTRDAEAKAVCARCPVRAACLAHAVFYEEPDSVWGGQNPYDRGMA